MENSANLDSVRDTNNDNQLIDRIGQYLSHLHNGYYNITTFT